ncbi:hypothetical protein [Phenylobacterium sp.]|jgi:hypothetical protein|uniref:hypothetical protein n=1 Tax=Phenylobacterium sp. TaxID=1871053 RepID=UPI003D2A908E
MRDHPIPKLRNLYWLLEQRLGDERRKPRPNRFTLQALERRRLQIKAQLSGAR